MAKREQFDVLLVRSGATAWEEASRIQGHTDLPLSPAGETRTGESLAGVDCAKLTLILHSPDEASARTAELVRARCAEGARTKAVSGLKEMDLGLWEGMLEDEARDRFAKAFAQWRSDPTAVTPPDGESLAEFEARLLPALRKALDKGASERVGVVVRNLAFGVLRCRLTDEPLSKLWTALAGAPTAEWLACDRSRLEAPRIPARSGA